jgi:hypothetical protein
VLRVEGADELRLAAAYFGRMDKDVRRAVAAEAKQWGPMLVDQVQRHAHAQGKLGVAVADTGKISATTKGLVASFGTSGYMKSGGKGNTKERSVPVIKLTGAEFGTNKQGQKVPYTSRGRSTGLFKVKRRVKSGMSARNPDGYFIFPAVAEMTPRLVSMWVKAITRIAKGGPAGG